MTTTIGAGVGAAIGWASESSYGTFSTPDRFTPFTSETLAFDPKRTVGKSLYGSAQGERQAERTTTTAHGAGDLVMNVWTKQIGLLLANMLGSNATLAQLGTSAAYRGTFSSGGNGWGQSLTVQKGVPDATGLIHPYNFVGGKLTQAKFTGKIDEPLDASFTFDFRDVEETDAYVAPTIPTGLAPFFFNQAAISIGAYGSEVPVEGIRDFTLDIDRPHDVSTFYMDGTGRHGQPVQNAQPKVTGSFTTDFLDKALFADTFAADTPQSLIITFTGPLIAAGYNFGLSFAIPAAHYDTETPKVGGPGLVQPKVNFTGTFDDVHPLVTVTYTTTDPVL